MELEQLRQKLMATARAEAPSGVVPFAFEKRVLARLGTRTAPDWCVLWSQALWRAAAPCAAVMILLGVWCWLGGPATASTDLSQEFDNIVLAAGEPDLAADSTW